MSFTKKNLHLFFVLSLCLSSLQAVGAQEPAASSSQPSKSPNTRDAAALLTIVKPYLMYCRGKIADLKTLICNAMSNDTNLDLNAVDKFGDTLLHWIVWMTWDRFENVEELQELNNIARLLLDRGANPLVANNRGLTPLLLFHGQGDSTGNPYWTTGMHKHYGAVTRSLEERAQLEDILRRAQQRVRMQMQGLARAPDALFNRLPNDVRRIVEGFAMPIIRPLVRIESQLEAAIENDDLTGLRDARNSGADANALNRLGTPMIMLAAMRSNETIALNMVLILLPFVDNPNPMVRGRPLLEYLREANRPEIVRVIEERTRFLKSRILFEAIRNGDLEGMCRALANGEYADWASESGTPAIMLAALRQDTNQALEMVRILIPHVANLNPIIRGRTLLDHLRATGDRGDVIGIIEEAMRSRGIIQLQRPDIAAQQPSSWSSFFFGN